MLASRSKDHRTYSLICRQSWYFVELFRERSMSIHIVRILEFTIHTVLFFLENHRPVKHYIRIENQSSQTFHGIF